MPWNFFRSKSGVSQRGSSDSRPGRSAESIGSAGSDTSTGSRRRMRTTRAPTPVSVRGRNGASKAPTARLSLQYESGSTLERASARASNARTSPPVTMHRRGVSMLDPESDPLSGVSYAPVPRSSVREPRLQSNAKRISSVHSVRSGRSVRSSHSSSRSIRSGAMSTRTKNLKTARMAKHAMAAMIASNGGKPLHCYTCQNDFTGLRCDRCRTAYLPPGFIFSAADALNGGVAMSSSVPEPSSSSSDHNSNASISTSTQSLSGAASLIGIVPDLGDDFDCDRCVDFDLINDLAACNDYGLLEAVIFDYFSNVDTVVNTFYRPLKRTSDPSGHMSDAVGFEPLRSTKVDLHQPSEGPNAALSGAAGRANLLPAVESIETGFLDTAAVNNLYTLLGSVSSTGPMRGILQGAEAVLLTRKHVPATEKEAAYICVILQCPAIVDCSMFTKITGPMQKLARYSSLRSRARMLLEVSSGLLVHADDEYIHRLVVNHLTTLDPAQFESILELGNAYISHRLLFHFKYKAGANSRPTRFQHVHHDWYAEDWRIIVVVKFLSLLWTANETLRTKKAGGGVPIFAFYNTMIDQIALQDDYDSWQVSRCRKKPRFCFCSYPFLLSAGSKAKIFEHGIKREVNSAVQREMFSIMADPQRSRSLETQQIQIAALKTVVLKVRRTNLLADSVDQLRNWHVSKRRELRIEFDGEQGIDAGGLKREWCLMFYRQLLDPALGAFVVDETSNYCWFAAHPDLGIYRAAGTALGLALYNSITIDFNLPLLLFKLLLDKPYSLEDVATLWPEIAQSLQSILDYDADEFEETFGLTFTAPDGTALLPDGESQPVTVESRELYVELLVGHLVNHNGFSPQLQAFKKAFLDACGCNAIGLFQPEELELLVRGDRKPIDVQALRSVTKYVNFGHRYEKANMEPVVQWFWDYFQKIDPQAQAELMRFVTATDRIPAAGMINMRFSIMCLGSDSERFPIAHTCFNQLCLYKYKTRRKLEKKISFAVAECQGFGLK